MIRKALIGIAAAAVMLSPIAFTGAPANAAAGDEIIVNGDFSTGNLSPATTDFIFANAVQGSSYGGNTMFDEGRYIIGTNPRDFHVAWANLPSNDLKMYVNGFEGDNDQTVWEQSQPGIVCPAGNQVTYDFSANVANILPLDYDNNGGAAISVWINGVEIDSIDLTTNDPANVETLTGNSIPALATMTLTIKNSSTVKIGNDFSLDNISLKQVGGCQAPVSAQFVAPNPPTCDADGFLDTSVFPIVRDGYTLTVFPEQYVGPGDYTITATPDATHYLEGPTSTVVHVLPQLNNCCVPTVTEHQWYNWTGGPVTSAPAVTDPNWHAVSGNPRSDLHKWENHPMVNGLPVPYQAGKPGKADWFMWKTTPGVVCDAR